MRVVLDVNILVSALMRPDGPPGKIVRRLLTDTDHELIVSAAILEELRSTLAYPKVRKRIALPDVDLGLWVEALGVAASMVPGVPARRFVPDDPDDDILVAAAIDGLAEVVVSGDRHLLDLGEVDGIRMVSARGFLEMIGPRERP